MGKEFCSIAWSVSRLCGIPRRRDAPAARDHFVFREQPVSAELGGHGVRFRSRATFLCRPRTRPLTGLVRKEKVNLARLISSSIAELLAAVSILFAICVLFLPCYKPAMEPIIARERYTGDIAWQTTLGTNQPLRKATKCGRIG